MVVARVVIIPRSGDASVLELQTRDVPDPGAGELRVAVAAAGLNRADVLQRRGLYPAPPGVPADVPGLEFAGCVEAVGAGVTDWSEGDRVMGIVGGGAMASHVLTRADAVLPVPGSLDLVAAAAVPEAFLTVYDALIVQGGLGAGQLALIHAVGSGLGTAAIQVARAAGASTAGTSRNLAKLERCAALGLDHGLHVTEGRFAGALGRATGGRAADVILDTVGAAYLAENVRAIAPRGTIVVVGLLGGTRGELDLGRLLARRARLVGSVLRSRPDTEKAELTASFRQHMLPLIGNGTLRPVLDSVLPMERVAEAHERMESNATFGKVVLAWETRGS